METNKQGNDETRDTKQPPKKMTRKERKRYKRKNHAVRYWIGFSFKVLLLLLLVTAVIVGIILFNKYGKDVIGMREDAQRLVQNSSVSTFRQNETSLVYDNKKKLISVLKDEKDTYYMTYSNLPDSAKKAFIAIEDKKFATHKGIDLKANIRAVVALVKHKGEVTQGASTITQQLSRSIFLTNEVKWERKIKEIFIALELEKKYTKEQILEFYINNIYFANGYYGLEAASRGYFNKSCTELSLSQITYLCSIPNNPTLYDPTERPENTVKRRDRILKQMVIDGYISESESAAAKAEEVTIDIKSIEKKTYVNTYIRHCAVEALMEAQGFKIRSDFASETKKKNYQAEYDQLYMECQESLFKSGYRIYTSIDTKKQSQLQKSIDEELKEYKDKSKEGIYKFQGAATCIDNKTGRVIAIVGGRSQKNPGYLNRAFQSYRQPGSSIKPLVVYTPAFEMGFSPEQMIKDEELEDGPSNAGDSYVGDITLREAVARSKNVIAHKVFKEVTPKKGISYLLNMRFNKIDKRDYGLATALGGLTYGASTVEMASGFAAIENSGYYRTPTCIVKITDSMGNLIVGDEISKKAVYEKNAAHMMTNVLQGVFTSEYGTGRKYKLDNMSCAGKTGTTNDGKDGWFVGYTPYYTTAVWVGYDKPQEASTLAGGTYPGRIWFDFMTIVNEGKEYKEFPTYTENEGYEMKDDGLSFKKEEEYTDYNDNEDEISGTEEEGNTEDNTEDNTEEESGTEWVPEEEEPTKKPVAPPVEVKPTEKPPVEEPPVEEPPAEEPPEEEPPVEEPPTEVKPTEKPPAEVKPTEKPPVEEPPAEEAPVEEAPVEAPDPGLETPDAA